MPDNLFQDGTAARAVSFEELENAILYLRGRSHESGSLISRLVRAKA